MAAANENQGLKIAVAAFVTLTVVLAVTTYFGFSQSAENAAKLAEATSAKSTADSTARQAVSNIEELQRQAGYAPSLDFAALKTAITKDQDELKQQLTGLQQQVGQTLQQYRAGGGDDQKVDQLSQAVNQTISQIISEPNWTFKSTQGRMNELVSNMTQLTTALSIDNADLHTSLNSVDRVNAQQLQVQAEAAQAAKSDLEEEHTNHEAERARLVQQVGELQTLAQQQQNEIDRLETSLAQNRDEFGKQRDLLLANLRELRRSVEAEEDVMDVPDGRIVYVDYDRNEVRATIGRRQGGRERLVLSVFDRDSPGLPTDRPKGRVELIRVNDTQSIARIVETKTPSNPIRNGDLLYSAAWSPNQPQRFALVGKMDIDQDGRDDREDLKRLIQQAGGTIDYDLPPPEVGQESGEISGLTTFYVLDNREPLRPPTNRSGDFPSTETQDWLAKKSAALEKAQENGVRPINIGRLLAYLGYSYGQAVTGRAEAINREAADSLLNRRNEPDATVPQNGDVEILTAPPGGF